MVRYEIVFLKNRNTNCLWKRHKALVRTGVSSEFCDLESEMRPVSLAVLSSAILSWCTSGVGREFELTSFGVLPRRREKEKKRIMGICKRVVIIVNYGI